jgi:hypothetical protein
MPQEKILELQQQYNNINGLFWTDSGGNYNGKLVERTFMLGGNGTTKSGIVKAEYHYIIANYRDPLSRSPEGDMKNKVKDIFNLKNTNDLFIRFKIIPRNIRESDRYHDTYAFNPDGTPIKIELRRTTGTVDSTFKTWKCYNLKTGQNMNLPKNFKWVNLMKYLAHYNKYLINNTIFDINHNSIDIKVRDDLGLIPYDYK